MLFGTPPARVVEGGLHHYMYTVFYRGQSKEESIQHTSPLKYERIHSEVLYVSLERDASFGLKHQGRLDQMNITHHLATIDGT